MNFRRGAEAFGRCLKNLITNVPELLFWKGGRRRTVAGVDGRNWTESCKGD